MQSTPIRTVFGGITDFLATEPSPQEMIDFYMPGDLQARLDELLDKNGEGELTPEEQKEMMDFARMDQVMSLRKIRMRIKLKLKKTRA